MDYRYRLSNTNCHYAQLEDDGELIVVIAHEDPGVRNWLTTEGRPFGLVFWRFMLPTGAIATPTAEVVPIRSLR